MHVKLCLDLDQEAGRGGEGGEVDDDDDDAAPPFCQEDNHTTTPPYLHSTSTGVLYSCCLGWFAQSSRELPAASLAPHPP